jgi:hypothetical protein
MRTIEERVADIERAIQEIITGTIPLSANLQKFCQKCERERNERRGIFEEPSDEPISS